MNTEYLPPWPTIIGGEFMLMKRLELSVLFIRLSTEPVVTEFKVSKSDKRSVDEGAKKNSFIVEFIYFLIVNNN